MSKAALWMTSSAPPMNSHELVDDVGEARLLREELVGDAVHLQRGDVDLAVGSQVAMKRATGAASDDDLDAADLDDAMTLLRLEPGGFGVEDDLAHASRRPVSRGRLRAAPRRPPAAALRSGRGASAG